MVACCQPYFRSSRASVWGCDLEGASGLSSPTLASYPRLAWLARLLPETQRLTPKLRIQQTSEREASPNHLLHQPLLSVYSVAVCGTDSFSMDSLKPRRLDNMGLITHLAPLCVSVCGCVCESVKVQLLI